ncbi:hypothetical protein A2572_04405 [Candidatus Collierbacteria bacterium RIFOXYD1_FULL_40_9]|uniref:Uncharacterized protein n=1 Tax=Candidatus Collierbacteria bacterium RIFOXYD1_FULL_40_9 TaxID=1817731 RepID=A0A1F5FPX2_9BACT|nr:MAG: hypothetical protein A2572_04405 [Candidatus Collierbacteria bacterium RIFOXYD1_FULL_40_9]
MTLLSWFRNTVDVLLNPVKKRFTDEGRVGSRKFLAVKLHRADVEFFPKHLRDFVDLERLPFP